jgi:hypothetical protein
LLPGKSLVALGAEAGLCTGKEQKQAGCRSIA